ncbi:MAG: hypothetical protein L0312_19380 [Acidobacteria bacterium]|nr:hypothetical protein [Acidobacteriota bacterium]
MRSPDLVKRILSAAMIGALLLIVCAARSPGQLWIHLWYGREQHFGRLGIPQRWVNVLGSVSPAERVAFLSYSLNGGAPNKLSVGKNDTRLAAPGDFNVELDCRELRAGENTIVITATDKAGRQSSQTVTADFTPNRKWPLPYVIDWVKVRKVQDAVQIVDGLWKLDGAGIRTVQPYYDRVAAVGDLTWTDYEAAVQIIFHGFTGPAKGPPHYGVTHAGIGLRWQGHADDGQQPHVQWYPLGAATEFQLFPDLRSCHWRIIPDGGKNVRLVYAKERTTIRLGQTYLMKARVESLPDQRTRYRTKIWAMGEVEPEAWAVESIEGAEDFQSGSLLLVAHNSDVTFGNLQVIPLGTSR